MNQLHVWIDKRLAAKPARLYAKLDLLCTYKVNPICAAVFAQTNIKNLISALFKNIHDIQAQDRSSIMPSFRLAIAKENTWIGSVKPAEVRKRI